MPFDLAQFTLALLAEALFYDAEYHVIGSVSLIDPGARQERYIAAFDPDEDAYLIEEANDWEPEEPDDEESLGYALATDGEIYGRYDTNEETAETLLTLARVHGLMPSFLPLFEEES